MSGDAYSRYSLTYGQAGGKRFDGVGVKTDTAFPRWQAELQAMMGRRESDELRIADSLEKIEKHLAALVEALGARDRSA